MKTTTRTGANHALHAAATAITCGLWSPVWIVCAILGRKTVTDVDLEVQRTVQFLQGGATTPTRDAQWPRHCPGCGEYHGSHLRGCQYFVLPPNVPWQ